MKIILPLLLFVLNSADPVIHEHEQPAHSDPISSAVLLETTTSWDEQPIRYPEGEAKVTAVMIELAPGQETGRHFHNVPSFAYILEGELEITLDDGRTLRAESGEAIAEVTNTIHNGRNIGEDTLRLVVFYTGTVVVDTLTVMQND